MKIGNLFGSSLKFSQQFLYANCVKIYQFKAKDSEIKLHPLCLGNNSKDLLT